MNPATAERLGEPFELARRLAAPRRLAFDAFTRAEHLAMWMGPAGFATDPCTVDLRIGGAFHYRLSAPDGTRLWGKWTFREIEPPARLVVVVQFSDAQAGLTRNPWNPTWPLRTLSTTTLAEDPDAGGDGTWVTLRWQPLAASDDEERTFAEGHASMRQGWGGTFDKLDAYLAQLRSLEA